MNMNVVKPKNNAGKLSELLKANNINTVLSAITQLENELNLNASIARTMVEILKTRPDQVIAERLILLLGNYHQKFVFDALVMFEKKSDDAHKKWYSLALAKLGEKDFYNKILAKLKHREAYVRYVALQDLGYVHNRSATKKIAPLLSDMAPAVRVGSVRTNTWRRVCDQAVDTLIALEELTTSFTLSLSRIYSQEELEEVKRLCADSLASHSRRLTR